MPVPPAARSVLADFSAVASRWGKWYVFGAQAVVAYGVPRLSADVDVTLALTPDTPVAFTREMADGGFALRVADPDFLERTRVMPFVHVQTGMPLDVVLAGSGLEDEFLHRARDLDIDGMKIPFLAIDDLIIAKVLAGRPKDVEDARGLWRIHGATLDEARMRTILGQLEEALGQSDLLPVFTAIVVAR